MTGQQKPDAKTLCEVSKSVSVVSDKEKCLTPVSFISNAMMRPDCVNVSNVPADKTLTLINPATEFYCKVLEILISVCVKSFHLLLILDMQYNKIKLWRVKAT